MKNGEVCFVSPLSGSTNNTMNVNDSGSLNNNNANNTNCRVRAD